MPPSWCAARTASARWGRGTSSRASSSPIWVSRRSSPRSASPRSPAPGGHTRSSTPERRTGLSWESPRWSTKATAGRAGPRSRSPTWARHHCGHGRSSRRSAPVPMRPPRRRRRWTAPARRAMPRPAPSTVTTWPRCSPVGPSRRHDRTEGKQPKSGDHGTGGLGGAVGGSALSPTWIGDRRQQSRTGTDNDHDDRQGRLLMGALPFESVEELQAVLGRYAYLADRGLATAVWLSLALNKPLLLEGLSEFAVTIPEIGRVAAERPPAVIITSNRTRELHDALKRRCLYHWIDHPSVEREVDIVRVRAPEVPEVLARQVARAVARLRAMDVAKRPGVAETIDWSQALAFLGAERLEPDAASATLGALVKDHEDLELVRAKLDEVLEPE